MKIYTYPSKAAEKRIDAVSRRDITFRKADVQSVGRMLEDVKKNGDKALLEHIRRFDAPKLKLEELVVTRDEIDKAAKQVNRAFMQALNRAASQIESFHQQQMPRSWIQTERPGVVLGQMVNAVGAAGIYVPGAQGGKTPLVSSVLMGAIPAKIAGVDHIAMATPPMADGRVDPHLLAAAKKVGVGTIYKMGSAWAVAALAYGTKTVQKVDVIVGPGNIYVTLAKKMVAGTVGIDMIAGPSEILILADGSADPEFIAADLLSQAEHDPLSSSILITTSPDLAQKATTAVDRQLAEIHRKDIAQASLDNYGGILVVPDIQTAIDIANRIAPEHLELLVTDPFQYIGQIKNAGAMFLGHYTPEPAGDYVAGPNHVLPTAGTARFASALSVEHFLKKTSLIHYSEAAFRKEAKDIIRLADTEGLGAHANSVHVRLRKK